MRRRIRRLQIAVLVATGVVTAVVIRIVEPGDAGFYAIALPMVTLGIYVIAVLDAVDKPDEVLTPVGIRSRDRWRRFLARVGYPV